MTLKNRLIVFIVGFIGLAIITGLGFISLSFTLREEIIILHGVNLYHKQDEELRESFSSYMSAISRYMNTGSDALKVVVHKRQDNMIAILKEIEKTPRSTDTLRRINTNIENVIKLVSKLLNLDIKEQSAQEIYKRLGHYEKSIYDDLDRLHTESLRLIDTAIHKGMQIQRNIFINIILLFVSSLLVMGFLVVMLKRAIDKPFRRLLEVTERISDGDLGYRITLGKDEFGILANRFYEIVDKLRLKLEVSELFLDISRPVVLDTGLEEFLIEKANRIAKTMNGVCDIYLVSGKSNSSGQGIFELYGSSHPETSQKTLKMEHLSFITDAGVLWSNNLETSDGFRMLYDGHFKSIIIAPLSFDNQLKGLMILRRREANAFVKDDLYTAEVLSHILSSGIRNHELYAGLQAGYERFRKLYEFGKRISSDVDMTSLLNKTVREISGMFPESAVFVRTDYNGIIETASYPEDAFTEEEVDLLFSEKPITEPPSVVIEDRVSYKFSGQNYRGILFIKKRYGIFTTEDIQLLEGLVSFFMTNIDRAMAFEQVVEREKETEESKRRIEILFDSVRGGIVSLDKDFRIVSINRYMEHWISSPVTLIGKDAREVFHEKAPVCPHCVALATFINGEINLMSQKSRFKDILVYSELTSYPVKDPDGTVKEVIVFIQDVSERVLYQEELMGLYREVMQTKEYLEGVIENTADAIVTSDLNGIVTSWNKGAERIYGYTENEVLGKYLPFIPPGLYDIEREYSERIRRGEVLKDIETYRVRKDGSIIEVSLTLSPIKDAFGNVIGISGISRDITEKKRFERELTKRNQELSRLFLISSAMRSTLELDRLLRMILTAVTMSDGLGFNRAILFLVDEEKNVLRGAMGVGPSSPEEAWHVWSSLSMEKKTLEDLMKEIEQGPLRKDSFLDRLSMNIEIPLNMDTVLTKAVKEKRTINVRNVQEEPLSDPVLTQQLGTEAYAVVPLISRDKVIGLLWVDNLFNRRPITDDDIRFLTGFSNQVAAAIENSRLFERVRLAEAELENIFESITDMVYITTADYTIQNINRAVLERLNKRCIDEGIERRWKKEDVIGKKCYQVFHGMDRPYEKCPHHKTVTEKKAFMEEFEDPYLGMTSFSSTSPLFNQAGEFMGTVHVVRDISELKRLRERLQTAEKMAALGEIAARVAHEIRNPLVSVGGFAKRLERKLDGSLKEYASIIVKEVLRLEMILRDILSFVRGMGLNLEELDINILLDEVVELYMGELKDRDIEVEKDYKEQLVLSVDAGRFKEAIINIFTNAVQAINKNGKIILTTYKTETEGVIIIKDTGPGIDEKDLPNIFAPFFTTKTEGTGLGLSITKKIIDEHGGRIEVQSQKGGGASFIIFLPLKGSDRFMGNNYEKGGQL